MATEIGMTEDDDREARIGREFDELLLACENLEHKDLRRWMQDTGYLLPTERAELVRRSNEEIIALLRPSEVREAYPPQTS